MINWLLIRTKYADTYTEGYLIDKDKNTVMCHVLEDVTRDVNGNGVFDNGEMKVYGETSIPFGEYEIETTMSPKFGKDMVLIKNVSDFTGVRMHWGATAGNSEGCPLVGRKNSNGSLKNTGMTDILAKRLKESGNKGILTII